MTDLPGGWTNARLSEICAINPRVDKSTLDPESVVSFVPMPAVEAETGEIDVSETRSFETVRKGYKPFRKGDILFAKITPCMENGKMAIVPDLASTYGFGSTEFHVLRPRDGVDPRYIYHAVSHRAFRSHAKHNMTGAVGQKRVPAAILEEHEIGLPPANEQRRIVEKNRGPVRRDRQGRREPAGRKIHPRSLPQVITQVGFRRPTDRRTGAQRNPGQARAVRKSLLRRIREERDRHVTKRPLEDWRSKPLTAWRTSGCRNS